MAGDFSAVRKRVTEARTKRDTITKADMDLSPGTPGSRERVASVQFNRPRALVEGAVAELAIMAYESFSADGNAGNSETFTLSHDPVDSGATSEALVVYEDDARLGVDSVDYDGDSVTVTPANADSTIGVFYASGEQAQVTVQKTAPNGTYETVLSEDIGLAHMRDTQKEPLRFSFTGFWEPIVPQDWTLDVFVDAPYTAAFAMDVGGDAEEEIATNALLDFPTRQATENIEGLKRAVRLAAAGR